MHSVIRLTSASSPGPPAAAQPQPACAGLGRIYVPIPTQCAGRPARGSRIHRTAWAPDRGDGSGARSGNRFPLFGRRWTDGAWRGVRIRQSARSMSTLLWTTFGRTRQLRQGRRIGSCASIKPWRYLSRARITSKPEANCCNQAWLLKNSFARN